MGDAVALGSVEEAFQVEETIQMILKGGYKTVRLLSDLARPSPLSNSVRLKVYGLTSE